MIEFIENFIKDTDIIFRDLFDNTPWRQDRVVVYGKEYDVPRLQQWYGDGSYAYSGIRMEPLPWTDRLKELKQAVEEKCEHEFNSVLLNLYRNGNDTVGWHSDDEPELGDQPSIVSLSFGAARDFIMRNKLTQEKKCFSLTDGSFLYMFGKSQEEWEHSLPRRKRVIMPRINLTFRNIKWIV